jgi:DNA-binding HxlR family transcriptional regulator
MSSAPALAFSMDNCQVAATMEVVGETGTMLVLREVFNGVRRFADMQRHSGLSRQVLSNRLATLVEHGILRREPYRDEGARVRHEYRLTAKGLDLYPVLTALAQWGERHLAGPEGVPVEIEHRGCGAVVRAVLVCDEDHRLDDPREVATRPGPGVRPFTG